jgi:P-type Ca2+ transporter type 2C
MAIGRNGDAAAREVADVFFATDDLSTLPLAIERGRGTYANIRKAIHYLLSTNTSEILLMLAGTAAGFGEMLSPIQLLWINLISDVLPAIGLAMEPAEPGVMDQAPTAANESMVRRDHFARLGSEAGILTASALGAGLCGAMRYGMGSPQARTMAFGSLTAAQLLHALAYRSSPRSVFEAGGFSSSSRLAALVGGSLAAQLAVMLVPGVRNLLGVAPLGILDSAAVVAGGIAPFLIGEAQLTRRAEPCLHGLHFRRPDPEEVGAQEPHPARRVGQGLQTGGSAKSSRLASEQASDALAEAAGGQRSRPPRAAQIGRRQRQPIR